MKKLSAILFSVFMLAATSTIAAQGIENNNNDEKKMLVTYEQAAYPGGLTALQNDANNEIAYPGIAYDKDIEGCVLVRFDVESDGSVDNIVFIDGPANVFGAAIEKFLHKTQWIPATANGTPIKSTYVLPLVFKI